MMSDISERIRDLETRFAHQEKIVAELNEVITAQWRKIELLGRQLMQLNEDMQTMDQSAPAADKPPPHY